MKKAIKILLALLTCGLCLTAVILSHRKEAEPLPEIPAATEEDRTAYLRSLGCEGDLIAEQIVTVPSPEDPVYTAYAALQERQLLPLADHAGKRATLYTYRIEESGLCAELLTADGILLGVQCYDPAESTVRDKKGRPLPES